ncbi:MAG TPA: TauD/TfdA family dioxygenase [Caulobacteraceae bacterium]|nr:TauD/TfdA family dioxygenase [Caulobacteraceae bacterium]
MSPTNSGPLQTRWLSGAVGVEATGLDLARPLAADVLARLRDAWLQAGVLVVRDQDLDPEAFERVAEMFGAPSDYPFLKGLPGHPNITEVVKLEHETVNFGGVWHSDTTYLPTPPMATLLLARQTPPAGGDTLFASQVAAYEALSEGMKRLLGSLRAISSSSKADVSRTREDRLRDAARQEAPQVFEALHPVVRTHPETGRRSLYVNEAHTVRFEGMTEVESAPMLEWLFRHQVRPEFTCRVSWAPGTLAIWDNRQVLHNPINDYHGHRRVMHRITLAGDVPGPSPFAGEGGKTDGAYSARHPNS